ncbi:MAG: phosphomannose isomerase type II C-terminal cupin domain [Parcubacteria group bacterium]|nr:phosphomannose isomerase type II C-terminal cupin domain [Parcubacteria group bacterium]
MNPDRPKVLKDERPWGSFLQYTHNEPSTVKLINIKQGERNSLQAHKFRNELWVITGGSIEVTLNDRVVTGKVGDEFWAPAGTKHRFKGLEESNQLLEVSFGTFDEGDNQRFEDDYGRA